MSKQRSFHPFLQLFYEELEVLYEDFFMYILYIKQKHYSLYVTAKKPRAAYNSHSASSVCLSDWTLFLLQLRNLTNMIQFPSPKNQHRSEAVSIKWLSSLHVCIRPPSLMKIQIFHNSQKKKTKRTLKTLCPQSWISRKILKFRFTLFILIKRISLKCPKPTQALWLSKERLFRAD